MRAMRKAMSGWNSPLSIAIPRVPQHCCDIKRPPANHTIDAVVDLLTDEELDATLRWIEHFHHIDLSVEVVEEWRRRITAKRKSKPDDVSCRVS